MSNAGEKFVVACPDCGKRYQVPRASEGKQGRCSCGAEFPLQAAAPSAIPEAPSQPPAHCVHHPDVRAAFACARCHALICQVCDTPQPDGGHLCPTCAATAAAPLSPWQPAGQAGPAGPAVAPPTPGGPMGPYAPLGPQPVQRTCTVARDALIISIVGIFCCVFLQIWALIKASEAKRMIAADPSLTGGGMATAAQIIAIVNFILSGLMFISNMAQMGQM